MNFCTGAEGRAANNEIAAFQVGDASIKIGHIMKILAALQALIFFLPLFNVSCDGMKITFNGWQAAFGKTESMGGGMFDDFSSEKVDGNIFAIILLIIPIIMLCLYFAKKDLSILDTKVFMISTALSVVGIINFIILAGVVNSRAEEEMFQANFTFWFYFSIFLHVAAGAISAWCLMLGKKSSPMPYSSASTLVPARSTILPEHTATPLPKEDKTVPPVKFCIYCGNPDTVCTCKIGARTVEGAKEIESELIVLLPPAAVSTPSALKNTMRSVGEKEMAKDSEDSKFFKADDLD